MTLVSMCGNGAARHSESKRRVFRRTSTAWLMTAALMGSAVFAHRAVANELWISPQLKSPGKLFGNWAISRKHQAVFTFHTPDNMTGFTGAKLVVIPDRDGLISYDLYISIGGNTSFPN